MVENNQSQNQKVLRKFPDLLENNRLIKDADLDIKLKPGHCPVKPKAGPMPLHLQDDVEKEFEKLIKARCSAKIIDVDEDCFISPDVITVKNDKSVKIALDSRKLNDSYIKRGPHMPNTKDFSNQISVDITKD